MSLLIVKDLTYQIAEKRLYQQANFSLHHGEHLGVTGENGVGKSTLLKLLRSELLPDQGEILWQPDIMIGYLDQHMTFDPELTIFQFLSSAFEALFEAEKVLNNLYAQMATDTSSAVLNRAAELQSLLEKEQFYSLNYRIEQIAAGLGIDVLGMASKMGSLSGGQRHKVMLAKLLLQQPEVLLLDEPTNFLDTAHVEWLANFLANYAGAFLVVSHDISFLDSIANGICDIDYQQIKKYKGHYSKAMSQKEQERLQLQSQYDAQQRQIQKLENYIAKNGAGVNAKIANGRKKQLAKIDRIEINRQKQAYSFTFKHSPLNAQTVIVSRKLGIGYTYSLLADLNLYIQRGEKIAVAGFNGVGKSTLLKSLIGEIPLLSGQLDIAKSIKWGYFAQELYWPYPESTPVQVVCSANTTLTNKTARKYLAEFGVAGSKAVQPIHTLSGGEQTKVKLCCLAVEETNVLVLDEPTTHLDIEMKQALKEALICYPGTVILVSHEREFIQGWPDRVIDISCKALV